MWGSDDLLGSLRGHPLARLLLGEADQAPASRRSQTDHSRRPPASPPRAGPYQPPVLVIGPGGVTPPEPPSFPVGPGGVVDDGIRRPPLSAQEQARADRYSAQMRHYGDRAGALAAAGRFQPRYGSEDPEAGRLRAAFNGRMPPIGPGGVFSASATERAAMETGIPQSYLDELITHESSGDDFAKASTSSATGAAQFIDSTWLRMMRQHGPRYGLPNRASDAEILALRNNRRWSALMAAEYTHENRTVMTRSLGREISEGEAYLGHFLGPEDAVDLIAAAEARLADARRFVSRQSVEANPRIFYEGGRYDRGRYLGGGRPRSAQEVVRLQTRRFGSAALVAE